MIQCALIKKTYYSINKDYTLCSGVKYKIKDSDNKYYYTIKNIRLPKKLENKVYVILNL